MKTPTALLALMIAQTSFAGGWCDGPVILTTHVSCSTDFTATQCDVGEPLRFARVSHDYPLMGELAVDYWQGSFTRAAEQVDVYRDDIYDCWGHLQQSATRTLRAPFVATFTIDNPNLHDDVAESFIANAPMTDDEAAQAYAAMEQACEDATTPSAPGGPAAASADR